MLDSNRAGARFKTSSIKPNRALTLKHQTESSRPLSLIRPIRADPSARIVWIDCHLCHDAPWNKQFRIHPPADPPTDAFQPLFAYHDCTPSSALKSNSSCRFRVSPTYYIDLHLSNYTSHHPNCLC